VVIVVQQNILQLNARIMLKIIALVGQKTLDQLGQIDGVGVTRVVERFA
jgi:hypothetical protein